MAINPRTGVPELPRYPSLTGGSTLQSTARGRSAFGTVPGAVARPDPAANLGAVYPNLTAANAQISENIGNELEGQLSPELMNLLKDQSAAFGVSSGMPGSQFAANQGLRNLGLTSESMKREGLQDYLAAVSGISATQTLDPGLQFAVDDRNAMFAAAPDPEMAVREQERMFREYLDLMNFYDPSAGTGATRIGGGSTLQNVYGAPPGARARRVMLGPDGREMAGSARYS